MDEINEVSEEDLWAALGTSSGRDRIPLLMELADRASQRDELDRATTLWQQIEVTSLDVGDSGLAAEAARMQGGFAFGSGEYATAADLYQRSIDGFGEAGMSREAASALWCLGDTRRAMGEFEMQLQAAEECRSIAEIEQAGAMAGEACLLQARALYMLDRDEESLLACEAGREHFRHSGKPERVAVIDDLALSSRLFLGHLDEALDLARSCLVLAQSDGAVAFARMRLAEVLLRKGEHDEALEQIAMAREVYRADDDLAGVAKCEELRAAALYDLGNAAEALAAFSDARVMFDATGFDRDALRCGHRVAIALHSLGEYRRAARLNQQLLTDTAELVDLEAAQWLVVRLLDNLCEDGRFEECVQTAEVHVGLWPEDAGELDSSHREFLGLYVRALDHCGRTQEATGLAEQVISSTPAREAGVGTAYCYEVRGRSRLAADEAAASQDFSHAIALLLVRGHIECARELSKYFLPVDSEQAIAERGPVEASVEHR